MKQEAVTNKPKSTVPPAVVAQTKTPVVAQDYIEGGWSTEDIDTNDILIPNILLMHPTSDLVKKGERNQGEIIRSTNNEVLAKRNETFNIVVFDKWKEWRIMKKNPGSSRYEFVRFDKWAIDNDSLPWEYEENGESFRRDKTLNFYGILEKDVKSGTPFPVKLSFVRTSFNTGRKIADIYTKTIMEKQAPTRQYFKIGSKLVEGKEESFFAFTTEEGDTTPAEARLAAIQWKKIIVQAKNNNTLKVHDVDEDISTCQTSNTTEF